MTVMISIYLFDRMEILDFAGPFSVFSTASRIEARKQPDAPALFEVITVGEYMRYVRARGGLMIVPHFAITSYPTADVLIIPGGHHNEEVQKDHVIEWIGDTSKTAKITASVCTGAFLLAKAGLLDGRNITTHWEDADELQATYPNINVLRDRRWVDSGSIVTSGGISAGIDMSLHLVARLYNEDLARRTARQMAYNWQF